MTVTNDRTAGLVLLHAAHARGECHLVDVMIACPECASDLPETCPEWCTNDHILALEEGNPLSESAVHIGPELAGTCSQFPRAQAMTDQPLGPLIWSAQVEKNGEMKGYDWTPFVTLDISDQTARRSVSASMTSGEIRKLAAQLLHLADICDFRQDRKPRRP